MNERLAVNHRESTLQPDVRPRATVNTGRNYVRTAVFYGDVQSRTMIFKRLMIARYRVNRLNLRRPGWRVPEIPVIRYRTTSRIDCDSM